MKAIQSSESFGKPYNKLVYRNLAEGLYILVNFPFQKLDIKNLPFPFFFLTLAQYELLYVIVAPTVIIIPTLKLINFDSKWLVKNTLYEVNGTATAYSLYLCFLCNQAFYVAIF